MTLLGPTPGKHATSLPPFVSSQIFAQRADKITPHQKKIKLQHEKPNSATTQKEKGSAAASRMKFQELTTILAKIVLNLAKSEPDLYLKARPPHTQSQPPLFILFICASRRLNFSQPDHEISRKTRCASRCFKLYRDTSKNNTDNHQLASQAN